MGVAGARLKPRTDLLGRTPYAASAVFARFLTMSSKLSTDSAFAIG